jgi:hypothetical protein
VQISGYVSVYRTFEKSAIGYYIGPPSDHLAAQVSAPALTLSAPQQPDSDSYSVEIAEGSGHDSIGNDCNVWITKIVDASSAEMLIGSKRLSGRQRTGLHNGSLGAVKVDVLCDPQVIK